MLIQLDDLPAAERFDFWWQAVGQSVVSVDASSMLADRFWAQMQLVDLGTVQVSRVRSMAFEARRTPRLIRSQDPGTLQLSVTLRGRSGLLQNRVEADLRPRDIVLYDTSRPFHAWTGQADEVSEGLIMQFPRESLTVPVARVQRALAVRLPGTTGMGAMLATALLQLTACAADLPAAQRPRVAAVLLDLLDGLLESALGQAPDPAPVDGRRALLVQVHAFIEQRLADPTLSPTTIAAAHNVSLRHLYALFQQEKLTVAGWIRARRLARAHRDLADPSLADVPVGMIASRWGFTSHSQFNRAFRTAYGIPPGVHRRARIDQRCARDDNAET